MALLQDTPDSLYSIFLKLPTSVAAHKMLTNIAEMWDVMAKSTSNLLCSLVFLHNRQKTSPNFNYGFQCYIHYIAAEMTETGPSL